MQQPEKVECVDTHTTGYTGKTLCIRGIYCNIKVVGMNTRRLYPTTRVQGSIYPNPFGQRVVTYPMHIYQMMTFNVNIIKKHMVNTKKIDYSIIYYCM